MLTLAKPQLAPAMSGRARQHTVSVEARVQEKGAKHLRKSRPKKVCWKPVAAVDALSSLLQQSRRQLPVMLHF